MYIVLGLDKKSLRVFICSTPFNFHRDEDGYEEFDVFTTRLEAEALASDLAESHPDVIYAVIQIGDEYVTATKH